MFGLVLQEQASFEETEADFWFFFLFKGKGSDERGGEAEVVVEALASNGLEERNC